MIHSQIEFHNVAELRETGAPGLRLQRVPEEVRRHLNPGAQNATLSPANCELRFVAESPEFEVTLSCPEGSAEVFLFYGGFAHERYAIGPEPRTLKLTYPEALRMLPPEMAARMPFSPRVRRLVCRGDRLHFHGVKAEGLRPPTPGELPRLRYLAYGTSITHGACASAVHLAYAAQTARRLGADLINLGVGGSAHCEPEFADFIAARDDWHLATLALSVNMVNANFPLEEFRRRTSYMVNAVARANTSRPVACITLYPYFGDFIPKLRDPGCDGTPEDYRQVLREVVAACPYPNVHLLEGTDILRDITGLTPDLIHPADDGMIQMGENLARRLHELLQQS